MQEQCATAFEQTQRLRKVGALKGALAEAISCAQTTCATILQVDCARWLEELRLALPSVVIEVRDADDRDLPEAQVFVDEQPLDPALRGRAFELDPGTHTLRVAAQGQMLRQRFLAVEGRKGQTIVARLSPPASTSPNPAAKVAATPQASLSSPRQAALFLVAVAGVASASWGYFGLRGVSRRGDLEQTCGGTCPAEGRRAIERDFLVADLSMLTAAVASGTAAWLWWGVGTNEAHERSSTRIMAAAGPAWAYLGFTGRL